MVDPDDKIKAFEYIDRYYEVLYWFIPIAMQKQTKLLGWYQK